MQKEENQDLIELRKIYKDIKETKINFEDLDFPISAGTLKELEEKYGKKQRQI